MKVRSTVGAGDSMVGAMAEIRYKLEINTDDSEEPNSILEINGSKLLRWGLSASCATLMKAGTELGQKSAIKKYYPNISIRELS